MPGADTVTVIVRPDDPNDGTSDETRQRLLTYRVDQLEEAVGDIRDAIKSIDKSLQALSMADMQQTQTRSALGRASRQIEELGKRVGAVEIELPTVKLVRNWVIGGVVGVLGMVGAAVVALVVVR